MSTYREIVYMCLDELKLSSDDSYFTPQHIIELANNYRAFLLKQRYSDIKKQIPESNYFGLCLALEQVPAIDGEPCEGPPYLRSTKPLPNLMWLGNPTIYPVDYYQGHHISMVSREKMRYSGYNKYLKNIIYASIAPDGYLYLRSSNPQFLYLERVRLNAIFEDPKAALDILCDGVCDILDMEFPMEKALLPQLIELIVKELQQHEYQPTDSNNNANDDISQDAQTVQNVKR